MSSHTSSRGYIYPLFLLAISFSPDCRADETAGAVVVVETLHETLLNVMKNADKQDFNDRYTVLEPVITGNFDIPLIAKVVISRHWEQLDDRQKTDFISQFNKLSISTYASRFNSYAGESFHTLATEILKKGRVLVKTEIASPDDEPVRLDYLMHNTGERWYIISVTADGINDLSLKRAEYASVIKENGFDALVAKINEKIQTMEKPPTN